MMRNTVLLCALVAATGCSKKKDSQPAPPLPDVRAPEEYDLKEYTKDLPGQGDKLLATIETSLGTLHCQLFPDRAPATVANFIGLATGKKPWTDPKTGNTQKGVPFYDGLTFHRVIPNFMIQGGDPTATGTSGPGYQFNDELSPDLDMGPGTLAMANAGVRNGEGTNGSQFFIMSNASRPDLAKKHSIFGHCNEVEVVERITQTPRGPNDKPETPVTMKITIAKG